jgi:hypothetical protein
VSRFLRTTRAGVKRRRRDVVVLGGLLCALAISPALANRDGSPACRWQPIVNGVRHLRPPADLESEELKCGIDDPVDLSPDIDGIERINRALHAETGRD